MRVRRPSIVPTARTRASDEHEHRKEQHGIDRDLAALAGAPRPHRVTSLRVTNSASSGTAQVPANGIAACSSIEIWTRIGSPQAATAGSTTIRDAVGVEAAVGQLGRDPRPDERAVAADHRRLPGAGRSRRVEDEPGVREPAEDDDRQQDRDEDERHDEDGLDRRHTALAAAAIGPAAGSRRHRHRPSSCPTSSPIRVASPLFQARIAAARTTRMIPAAMTYSSVVRPRSSARMTVQARRTN